MFFQISHLASRLARANISIRGLSSRAQPASDSSGSPGGMSFGNDHDLLNILLEFYFIQKLRKIFLFQQNYRTHSANIKNSPGNSLEKKLYRKLQSWIGRWNIRGT